AAFTRATRQASLSRKEKIRHVPTARCGTSSVYLPCLDYSACTSRRNSWHAIRSRHLTRLRLHLFLVLGLSMGAFAASDVQASFDPVTISTQATALRANSSGLMEIYASATITSASSTPAPTGTVAFDAYGPFVYPFAVGPESCTGTPAFSSTNAL